MLLKKTIEAGCFSAGIYPQDKATIFEEAIESAIFDETLQGDGDTNYAGTSTCLRRLNPVSDTNTTTPVSSMSTQPFSPK